MTKFIGRRLDPAAPVLGRLGSLDTRLARNTEEIKLAQQLRYEIFYGEMGAKASEQTRRLKRDKDAYDKFCDHLLVLDKREDGTEKLVGTYRLLLDTHANDAGSFYSQGEFDLMPMLEANSNLRFMELGRSCILREYRSRRTMELLWHGNWAYSLANGVDVMFGCASFEGTDPEQFASSFAWLANNVMLDKHESCPSTHKDSLPLDAFADQPFDNRRSLAALPPLLKGYLRLGAKVGSHAVVDHQFGTTDVLVVLKVADINPRYLAHYGVDASRFAA